MSVFQDEDNPAILPPGKLPAAALDRLIERYRTRRDARVTVEPGYGRDAAAIDVRDVGTVIVKSDPITFTTEDAASYLVAVNANDIACLGGIPRWLTVVALFADGSTDPAAVEKTFAGLQHACDSANVSLIGGHSEITVGLPSTILVGTMIGTPGPRGVIKPGGGRPGDDIWMTQSAGIEGTAILAHAGGPSLQDSLGVRVVNAGRALLVDPGLVITNAASLALSVPAVKALHDPTEGGVATAVHELSAACRSGACVEASTVPILDVTTRICRHYGLDPLGLLGSGALLIVAAQDARDELTTRFAGSGIPIARIGTLTTPDKGVTLETDGGSVPLTLFDSDELTRVLAPGKGISHDNAT